ncbi:polysaccharide biosynthesis/export family protein [Flavobacterium silvaticum]|uniref:Polysaccharide export protein n=1 Tax=Flavobacterium silvaticum TaxID=1852020 RepID=A0A972FUD1_9FLAO|nr:polysaccharide biosynthesis/export family protein [Flavobacterium silvaticum]NMH29494.1 polysaccharide export protein [Flavobacterium silvaticum]
MSISFQKCVAIAAVTFLLGSCASPKKIVYVQDIEGNASYEASKRYEAVLQPDDILGILVTSISPEVAAPFNMGPSGSGAGSAGSSGVSSSSSSSGSDSSPNQSGGLRSYLIDNSGYIDFPVLGKIKLGGLTKSEANALMVKKISEYITDPIVTMRILNYKISVLGEVKSPGVVESRGERITLLDALSAVGDLTIYGRRHNILIIREVEGKKTYNRIDITKSDFLNSPFYYLAQNDVVYVEPNRTKVNSSVIGADIGTFISLTSLAITIFLLITR